MGKYTLLAQGLDGDEETAEVIMATDDNPERLADLRDALASTLWKMTARPWRHGYFLIIDENGYLWNRTRRDA